ncbi:BOI-related E3 ubiquitin-protein ligase 1-like [Phalaenopsis equestris]|uniref:BOI-related E3 ubiquitin-protein ligase 1-like n=1 Tax=Phalaenopsis equestris TaxID=78828 RepID=UPI0009E570FD|nr:BOI-related E3 ubiquitin-protein ligase 1-like [Phalaenopsis equestris]
MFVGNNTSSTFPFFLEENPQYYDSNASTQLQLFANISSVCDADQLRNVAPDFNDVSALKLPNKRSSESVEMTRQNNIQISLNNLFYNKADKPESIPDVNTVSTGLRLSYDDDDHLSSVTTASGSMPSLPLSTILNKLGPEIEHQTEEFNRYLRMQEEQFVKAGREMLQRHLVSFVSIIESELLKKLHDKDLEIESINRKNRELADRIRLAAAEAQTWQQRAKYNESIVHTLQSSLQQVMAQGVVAAAAKNGREGCGDSEVDSASSSGLNFYKDGGHSKMPLKRACKACRERESCMLMLPCRHMCLCRICDGIVDGCPICFTRKTASVEVNMWG